MEIYKSRRDAPLVDWQWYEPSLRNITHLIVKSLPMAGGRVLDVGCGTGRVSIVLAERGFQVTGIDSEPRVIEIAKIIAEQRLNAPTFEVVDFRQPAVAPANSYDVVVCSEVLEHVEDYRTLLDNIFAALKPGPDYQ